MLRIMGVGLKVYSFNQRPFNPNEAIVHIGLGKAYIG